jgi:hypothetical protein
MRCLRWFAMPTVWTNSAEAIEILTAEFRARPLTEWRAGLGVQRAR